MAFRALIASSFACFSTACTAGCVALLFRFIYRIRMKNEMQRFMMVMTTGKKPQIVNYTLNV